MRAHLRERLVDPGRLGHRDRLALHQRADGECSGIEAAGEHLDREVAVGDDPGHRHALGPGAGHDQRADMVLAQAPRGLGQAGRGVDGDDMAGADRREAHGALRVGRVGRSVDGAAVVAACRRPAAAGLIQAKAARAAAGSTPAARHRPSLPVPRRTMLLSLRHHRARRAAFAAGAGAVGPSLPAMAAWGLVTGVAMATLGLGLWTMLGLTFVVYSGTSQLAVLPLMAASTGVLAMVGAAAVANLRFVVYSAVLSRHLRRVPLTLRLATGFVTIDGPLAALLQRQREAPLVQRVAFLNGANAITAAVWCASSLLGIALAAALPFGPELAYVGVLALFGITVPMLVGQPAWAAAAASIAVALAGADWPHRLGTFAAVLAGVAAALLAARLGRRRDPDPPPAAPAARN